MIEEKKSFNDLLALEVKEEAEFYFKIEYSNGLIILFANKSINSHIPQLLHMYNQKHILNTSGYVTLKTILYIYCY